jgi:4-amino-4-deoxy-L-arabinose transferase-like glycosyltransferase
MDAFAMRAQAFQTIDLASEPNRARGPDRVSVLSAAAILVLSIACQLPLLGDAPLAGTEGHRVIPALNMVRTGDWILPRLFGQLYLMKPPLHDWLIAIAQILSGRHGNEFAWRLPSVVMGALLNMALYLFGARWFGRMGGIVSGLCGLGLLCLWGQARTADVDSTNTTACSIAALCLIELYFGRPVKRWAWIVGAGMALGATLMSKGPAGLPLILGVFVWAVYSRKAAAPAGQLLRSASFWGPVLIGTAIFAAYAIAAKIALNRLHLPPDYGGVAEVGNKFYPASWKQLLIAFTIPWQAIIFTMPVSAALPLSFVPEFRNAIAASELDGKMPRLRLATAMAASVVISWAICVATGMINPRYAYVTVAPLCLLAGAIAASWDQQIPEARSVFRILVLGCLAMLPAGAAVLTAMAWHGGIGRLTMLAAMILSTAIALAAFYHLATQNDYRAAWGLLPLLVLASVPFAYQFRLDRFDRSGYSQAQNLREYVGGSDAPVLTGAVLHSLPELFWYAGLHPHTTPTFALQNPRQYSGGTWVVMDPEEYRRWSIFAPRGLHRLKKFLIHKDVAYVAWFEREDVEKRSTSTTVPK